MRQTPSAFRLGRIEVTVSPSECLALQTATAHIQVRMLSSHPSKPEVRPQSHLASGDDKRGIQIHEVTQDLAGSAPTQADVLRDPEGSEVSMQAMKSLYWLSWRQRFGTWLIRVS